MTECVNCGNSIPKSSLMCPYCNAVQEERTILLQDMPESMPPQFSDQQQVSYGQPMQPGANQQPNAYATPNFAQPQAAPQITYPQQTASAPQMKQVAQQPAQTNGFGKGLFIGIAATAVVAGIVIALILLL